VVRQAGLRSTLLHNLVGNGQWDVLIMNALIGMGPGGIPVSISLLQQQEPDGAQAAAAGVAGGGCVPCGVQQQAAGLDVPAVQQRAAARQAGARLNPALKDRLRHSA
jgi:hypothetical protein